MSKIKKGMYEINIKLKYLNSMNWNSSCRQMWVQGRLFFFEVAIKASGSFESSKSSDIVVGDVTFLFHFNGCCIRCFEYENRGPRLVYYLFSLMTCHISTNVLNETMWNLQQRKQELYLVLRRIFWLTVYFCIGIYFRRAQGHTYEKSITVSKTL